MSDKLRHNTISAKLKDNQSGNNKQKSRFIDDVLTLVGGTAFAQTVSILSAPILTRLYTPESFGILALFISITSIIGIIACMRYEASIMLPESDEEAANLLSLSMIFVLLITFLSIPLMHIFKQDIITVVNSPQLETYMWLIPPFIFINGTFLALNYWNSRTKNFKRLSFARVADSLSGTSTKIGIGLVGYITSGGLIIGTFIGKTTSTFVLLFQIWECDKQLLKSSVEWKKIAHGLIRYKKFPLIDSWSALLNTTSWQLPAFLLAFFFSPTIVGFYSLGFNLIQLPMSFIGGSISQVFFQKASATRFEGNLDTLVESVFKTLVIIGMFPILTLTLIGSDLFSVIFGQAWVEAGVYAQILSLWAFVWFISSPLSTLYLVMEKQQFGLRYNLFNFTTRLLSLSIGGYIGNARIALILFAISGIMTYGYLCIKVMNFSGLNTPIIFKILFSNMRLFLPAGITILIVKIFILNQYIIVGISSILICIYYIYIIMTDNQINSMVKEINIVRRFLNASNEIKL